MLEREILSNHLNFPLFMAPMVGLSHRAFRRLVRSYIPQNAKTLWPTEMLNSRRIPSQHLGQSPESLRDENEDFLCPQILCNEEWAIAASIPKLETWGAHAIDINMGCPVKKALKHNYGVALMGDISYAAQVVAMAKKHSHVPISVKLRTGLSLDLDFLMEFGGALQEAGASWLCLHPRTAVQKRRGVANWELIALLREKLSIPVIGNGDVQNLSDVKNMLKQTNCDAVMVGRALTARPWLFWQLGEDLGFSAPKGREGESAPRDGFSEAQEFSKALKHLVENLFLDFSESLAKRRFMFYLRYSGAWLDFGNQLYGACSKQGTKEELQQCIDHFFSNTKIKMSQTTLLR